MAAVADKVQLNLWIDRQFDKRLRDIGREFGRSRTELALEILTDYFDTWVALAEEHRRSEQERKARVRAALLEKPGPPKAVAEGEPRVTQGRKKR